MKQNVLMSYFSRINFWNKNKKNKPVSTKTGGGVKAFMSKLSGAFLLPISVIAIGGLFLGVGATIAGQSQSSAGKTFGEFIKQLGDPLFAVLPLLFAAAIAVSFTEEAGIAVFNAIIGYAIFSALQSVFITDVTEVTSYKTNLDGALILDGNGNPIPITKIIGYKVLFSGGLRNPGDLTSIVGNSLGFKVLQTSVFGGIIVGFIVQWSYNRFHTIQLPQVISFFGGKRFVAFVVTFLMVPLAFAFLILWPYIGYMFNWIGKNSGEIPYGFDSFIFGFIERSLVPFGLHHVFYSPLWYTAAGADLASSLNDWVSKGNVVNADDLNNLAEILKGTVSDGKIDGASVFGDSITTTALVGFNGNNIRFTEAGQSVEQSQPLFDFIQDKLKLRLGRFLDGKFSFMQWGLPFAGLAMVLAAPKENRKVALGIVLPASLTCFITGVTEPIEFTFLFLAPAMFFGFHAFMCALSFMLMNVLGVHIAQTFSGGFLDLMIYGAIPVLKGTHFWWTFVVGAAYAPIYFFVFYYWIKKADLPTPGRGGNTKLFTKKDYQAQKNINSNDSSSVDPQVNKIIVAFGGRDNIVKTANCASRLRFDVVDADRVDESKLKEAGAFGVRKTSKTHVQAIFGPVAEQLRSKIDLALKSNNLNNVNIKEENNENILTENNLVNTQEKEQTKNCDCSIKCQKHCLCVDCHNDSLLSDNGRKFKEYVNQFGGFKKLLKYSRREETVYLTFKSTKNIDIEIPNLFGSKSFEIDGDHVKLKYSSTDLAKKAGVKIKNSILEMKEQFIAVNKEIFSPVNKGKLKSLNELNDGVFSEKLLGNGFVVEQKDGNVYSPINGEVIVAFPTKHAYGIQDANGLNVLVHIGVDTVKLDGKGFTSNIKQGQYVKQGDLLATVDLNIIKENNLISDVIVVVTPESKIVPKEENIKKSGIVTTQDVIIDKLN